MSYPSKSVQNPQALADSVPTGGPSDWPYRPLRQLQHLLVPVDFTPASEMAASYALALARAFEARVTLLHVVAAAPLPSYPEWCDLPRDLSLRTAEEKMCALAERFSTSLAGIRLQTVVTPGKTLSRICTEVWDNEVDLLVLATHRHSRLGELFRGSLGSGLLRQASCPALILPSGVQRDVSAIPLHRILIPLDFSGRAEAAVESAALLAERVRATVSLMHVLDRKTLDEELLTIGSDFGALGSDASSRLHSAAGRLLPDSKLLGSVIVRTGEPFAQILAAADAEQTDLLAMTTHGRTGLAHLVMGSTAERVLQHASCPVLIVRRDCE